MIHRIAARNLSDMRRYFQHLMITSVLVSGGLIERCTEARAGEQDWPQWRGPLGTGFAPESDPPVEWSESKNVRWKVALTGKGHSTPIVLGDRIFLTTAIPYGELLPPKYSTAPGTHDSEPVTQRHEFVVLAINRRDGTLLPTRQFLVERRRRAFVMSQLIYRHRVLVVGPIQVAVLNRDEASRRSLEQGGEYGPV